MRCEKLLAINTTSNSHGRTHSPFLRRCSAVLRFYFCRSMFFYRIILSCSPACNALISLKPLPIQRRVRCTRTFRFFVHILRMGKQKKIPIFNQILFVIVWLASLQSIFVSSQNSQADNGSVNMHAKHRRCLSLTLHIMRRVWFGLFVLLS